MLLLITLSSCVGPQAGPQAGFKVTSGNGGLWLTREVILHGSQASAGMNMKVRMPLNAKNAMEFSGGYFKNGEFKVGAIFIKEISFNSIYGESVYLNDEWTVQVVWDDAFSKK
jgi:hypothetical protein